MVLTGLPAVVNKTRRFVLNSCFHAYFLFALTNGSQSAQKNCENKENVLTKLSDFNSECAYKLFLTI